jgi:hypothetical protein
MVMDIGAPTRERVYTSFPKRSGYGRATRHPLDRRGLIVMLLVDGQAPSRIFNVFGNGVHQLTAMGYIAFPRIRKIEIVASLRQSEIANRQCRSPLAEEVESRRNDVGSSEQCCSC